MDKEHYGVCRWDKNGYESWTPFGKINMFDSGGQRAVELFLLSAAACLNFYLVEYVRNRNLPVRELHVRCDGEMLKAPERVGKMTTVVRIDADLSDKDRAKMVKMCERACKVMNTLKDSPTIEVVIQAIDAPK